VIPEPAKLFSKVIFDLVCPFSVATAGFLAPTVYIRKTVHTECSAVIVTFETTARHGGWGGGSLNFRMPRGDKEKAV